MKGPSYFSESLGAGVNLSAGVLRLGRQVQLFVNTQNLRINMCFEGMPDFVSLKGY